MNPNISRRHFVTGGLAVSAALGVTPRLSWAALNNEIKKHQTLKEIHGHNLDLTIDELPVNFIGKAAMATAINGTVPAPVLRWKEGETVTIKVTNRMNHTSSIHWHGLILPTEMDGVPGLSFDGIPPGKTFTYQFKLNQSGTYWYHSHSGFQEQTGMYGAIVIEPKEKYPFHFDREFVVQLSDWSDTAPEKIYANLKKMSHYYNRQERTAQDLWQEVKRKGVGGTFKDRQMWNQMRMSDRDIADVTGYAYTFLMNGNNPEQHWRAVFNKGEKILLRFINSSAMTIFDVRIPGLKMKVVASDGQYVEPVSVDEFRMGVAETYDVLVEPDSDVAYCLFAQSIDRSGFACGSLTPNESIVAEVPEMDIAPILTHQDMGMNHKGHGTHHAHMGAVQMMQSMNHNHHGNHIANAGQGSQSEIIHQESEFGFHVDMRSEVPQNGVFDPGVGLRSHQQLYGRKVLNYGDLANLYPTIDKHQPEREIQLHLTGNMSRYMWSMNGIKFADAEPIRLKYGERLRIVLVNDTMMTHPFHLHGMWSELENGCEHYLPRKHTILVQPGAKVSYLVTADAIGRWAYHCHLMFHMLGMMREVRVEGRV